MNEPTPLQPYYIVRQSLEGTRLHVWVQHGTENEDREVAIKYCQRSTSKPEKYCRILAKVTERADRLNAKRAALQIAMKNKCN